MLFLQFVLFVSPVLTSVLGRGRLPDFVKYSRHVEGFLDVTFAAIVIFLKCCCPRYCGSEVGHESQVMNIKGTAKVQECFQTSVTTPSWRSGCYGFRQDRNRKDNKTVKTSHGFIGYQTKTASF